MSDDTRALPPDAWRPAASAARRLVSPIQRFLAIEAASGLLLVAATALALILANSAWHGDVHAFWETPFGFVLGGWDFARPLHFWVNDGLMTIFFFVVGLEIRREIHEGELSDLRRAALPLAAALGGMLIPAGIYVAFNHGRAGAAGWGIPMATDIAFAVGVLTLLGKRVPPALRVLLLALAVIDDIGAIVVIAIFYSGGIAIDGLVIAAGGVAGTLALRTAGVRSAAGYLVPGAVVWAGLYHAGIHPTLAGVVLGMMTPVRSWLGRRGAAAAMHGSASALPDAGSEHEVVGHVIASGRAAREALSPSAYLQQLLHPWVAFAIMPLFALANAGVALGGASLDGDGWYVFLGIVVGLAVGKPVGVFAAARFAVGSGLSVRPRDVTYAGLGVVGIVAGIGFTMSLFIAQLAFPPGPMLETAKLAILAGSGAAMLAGGLVGVLSLRARPGAVSEGEAERDHRV